MNIVCILSMLLSACGLKLPSHVNLPTQLTGGDPQTLEAATAAAQERVNRFRSGDYAGAWLLSSRQMHDAINQTDYVTFEQTCASAQQAARHGNRRSDGPGRPCDRP